MKMTRRTFLVTAAAAGAAGGLGAVIAGRDPAPGFVWRGSALGGEARISLYGADRDAATSALAAVAREIERLEEIFSLHRPGSELCRLNAAARLDRPSRDLLEVVRAATMWRDVTGGAFDPTVQTIWKTVAEGGAVTPELLDTARAPIAFARSGLELPAGSALTLNGIAQGRITDRISDLIAAHGFSDVVIHAGELRLPGKTRRAVGIPAARAAVSVADVAIATSEPRGLVFDHKTWRHHLIDPRTGMSPRHWESISVFAPTAEAADALSTGFSVLPHEAVAAMVDEIGDIAIIGRDGKGRIRRFGDQRLFGGRRNLS